MKRTLILCLVVASVTASRPSADEGRIPIFRQTTITQPGHYILTRDVQVTLGPAIGISAGDVTIDLNGHLITGSDANSALITVLDVQNARVTIRNGRLSGGGNAIASLVKPGLRLRVENVEIESTALQAILVLLVNSVRITGCRMSGMGGDPAVLVTGSSGAPATGQVADNVITDVSGGGFTLVNFRGGVVRGNVIENFGVGAGFTQGIILDASGASSDDLGGNVIDGNTVRKSDDDFGIFVNAGANNLLTSNTATGLGATGIIVNTGGNRLANNISSRNTGNGATIGCSACTANHNVLERNTFSRNTGDGVLVVGGSSLIDGNLIEGNNQFGIEFDTGTNNAYRDNMLRGNLIAPVLGTATDAGGNIL